MPIYEYACRTCGHALEAFQKMSDTPLSQCPECGKQTLDKQVSAAAFRLKGTGWYQTDFKDQGKKKKSEKQDESKPEVKSETQSAAKTETKSEAKTEAKTETKSEAKTQSTSGKTVSTNNKSDSKK